MSELEHVRSIKHPFNVGPSHLPPDTSVLPPHAGKQEAISARASRTDKVVLLPGGRLSFDRYLQRQKAFLTEETGQVAIPAPWHPVQAVCPICRGAGYVRVDVPFGHPDFGKPKRCTCNEQHQLHARFGGAHLPADFQDCSFESYLQLPLSPEQQQAAIQVVGFVLPRLQEYEGKKRGLYLYGAWGTGKTGLAIAALRQAIAAGKSGLYLSTTELFQMLYESIAASQRLARGNGEAEDKVEEAAGAKLLRLVERVEWLVLDDVGVECGTEYVVNQLYRIIEGRRARRDLYTIFTSNHDARGLAQRWRPRKAGVAAFDDCYRVIERIGEYCTIVPVAGRNLRRSEGVI